MTKIVNQLSKLIVLLLLLFTLLILPNFSVQGVFNLPSPALAQDLGRITPPNNIPSVGGDPSGFVAGIIRNGILLMVIIAFIVALIWTILAGFRFIFAQGDPKTIATAWGQIYWGIIGLVVVVGAFALIKIVETFFNVDIISGGLKLPNRLQ